MESWRCRLVCNEEKGSSTCPDILLKHGRRTILGRDPETGIKDTKCSRHQLELCANLAEKTVSIRQLGPNCGSVNGEKLIKDQVVTVKSDSQVCFVGDQHRYKISFDRDPNAKSPQSTPTKKRTLEDHFGGGARKKLAVEDGEDIKPVHHDISDSEGEEERVREAERRLEEMRRGLSAPGGSSKVEEKDRGRRSASHPQHSDGPKRENEWQMHKGFIMYHPKGLQQSNKIAAFDLDWTVIATKTGHVFPTNSHDWRFLFPEVPVRLRNLHTDGFKIVLFSNQSGIQRGKELPFDFCKKVEHIVAALELPAQAFVSTGRGMCRKPRPGMWEHLAEQANGDAVIDYSQSFFVGDAAGRPLNWAPKRKKDFSVSDRLFAMNIGVPFFTPEEFFLKQSPGPYILPKFSPKSLLDNKDLFDSPDVQIPSKSQELIVLVGLPAAGKSHFTLNHLLPLGYQPINRDTLGTWQRCVSRCNQLLDDRQSVVIDNTNLDAETRKRYLDCASRAGVLCRCFIFNALVEHAKHNNKFRSLLGTDGAHKDVNDITLNYLKGKFQEPTLSEGFSEIARVNFVPAFTDPDHEKLYTMYLSEK